MTLASRHTCAKRSFFVLILVNNDSEAKFLKTHTKMQQYITICFLYACSKMMGASCDLSWFCLLVQKPFLARAVKVQPFVCLSAV